MSGNGKNARRRGVDLGTLLAGLATLGVAGYVADGAAGYLGANDLRVGLAAVAVFIGVLILALSLRSRRGRG
ncbi:hypothetical protein C1701_13695 [Actinoalloteichus sp. AHMU CJ021]|uniref:Uncharacterized protein n=1 Tax=Actinoalloteichus caeruleus DSM 43889 TaxID=1120930 RepID=A0ABT1JML8_ACTCY|nr:hypothetical protein [Actinoalloteichus caeruleus]AUS79240.1 hypothetical protein C1701_13695 [Actinoalloteichus sp. AHMU CJ021]MCP2333499.1 hypothetical protein [Actinoalloteichus caeruleus DSM 43889]